MGNSVKTKVVNLCIFIFQMVLVNKVFLKEKKLKMEKSNEQWAAELVHAMDIKSWRAIKTISSTRPMSIVASVPDEPYTPLYFSFCHHPWCARYLCHVLFENGISVDDVSQCPTFQTLTYCSILNSAFPKNALQILVEYGGGSNQNNNRIDTTRNQLQVKWDKCLSASAAILLLRKNRRRNFIRLVGHDMARLIAQEVWATKRHIKWED